MDQDSKRLGSALQVAREALRPKVGQERAADAIGVSRTTIQNFEHGKFQKVSSTIREYARFLGWPDGEADRIFEGREVATAAEQRDAASGGESLSGLGLAPAVEFELRSSETLGSQVINLGPDEEDGHIIIVLQGKKGSTPAQIERVAERFRKARRHLQGIAADAADVEETSDS